MAIKRNPIYSWSRELFCAAFAIIFLVYACFLSESAYAKPSSSIVQSDDIKLYTESFGKKSNPAVLLIMGAGTESYFWPDAFCEKLAKEGLFVIRYDHRDTGRSSSVDYDKEPYTLRHLTEDALAVLDASKIAEAHIIGFSMGGMISQFVGAYYPDRAKSLVLMATTTDILPLLHALEGVNPLPGELSQPNSKYIAWATRKIDEKPLNDQEKIEESMQTWRILSGTETDFDENLYQSLVLQSMKNKNNKHENSLLNHVKAVKASLTEHQAATRLIKTPSLIIHGTSDPTLGLDHAQSLKTFIPNAKLAFIQKMGHSLQPQFYDQIITLIKEHVDAVEEM